MKICLILALILLLAVGALAQILGPILGPGTVAGGLGNNNGTFHDGSVATTGGSTAAATIAVTSGDGILCAVSSTSVPTNTLSCADTNSDSFVAVAGPCTLTSTTIGELFYAKAGTTNASEVVTITVTNTGNYASVSAMSITPTSSMTLDQASGCSGSTYSAATSLTSAASSATLATDEIVVAMFANLSTGATVTAGSGYSNLIQASTTLGRSDTDLEWKNITSTGAQTGTATASAPTSGLGLVATFGH